MAVRTIGTDIKLTGEKEFNDGMKSINSNLKVLKSDMAAVAATFDDNANSVDALAAKNKILQDSYDQQKVKVDALQQMYDKVAKKYGENSAEADRYKIQLNNATAAMAKAEKELRNNAKALDAAKAAAKEAERPVEELADANQKVARTADDAADALGDMADKAEKTGNILPSVAQGFGSAATGAAQATAAVLAVGAAMGTAAITTLVSFAKESAEAAKAMEEEATAKITAANEAIANAKTKAEKAAAESAKAEAEALLASVNKDWLAFSDRLDQLDSAAAKAKRAVGGIILPQLQALSKDSADYLNNFAQSLEEAAGDTEKQAEVISEYVAKGAELLLDNLPDYIHNGKILLNGLKNGFLEAAPEIWETIKAEGANFADGLKDYGPQAVEKIVTGISDALPQLGTAAGEIVGELIAYLVDPDTLSGVAEAAWSIGEAIAKAIWNGLKALFTKIVDIPGLVEGMNNLQQYQMTGTVGTMAIPGHADGLNRVPYDNYLARLHKDEMVLTASEAERYRNGRRSDKIAAILNLTFNAKTITREDAEMVAEVINEKLGDLIE